MKIEKATGWQIATVTSVHDESPRVKLFQLELPVETKFRAGQFFDIRLTAPDGYQAQRSYSITSSPDQTNSIELAIEHIRDGEVSSYFHEVVEAGSLIEVRGPFGGHFTWSPSFRKPILLIGGGSGIAPLMSMLRHRASTGGNSPALLMFSVRQEDDVLFKSELEQMARDDDKFNLIITLTRLAADHSEPFAGRATRRIDRTMIDSTVATLGGTPARAYVCGGSNFVEAIGNQLADIGLPYEEIRTERFGP